MIASLGNKFIYSLNIWLQESYSVMISLWHPSFPSRWIEVALWGNKEIENDSLFKYKDSYFYMNLVPPLYKEEKEEETE